MKKLTLFNANTETEISHPIACDDITENSPALNIFTDFRQISPLVIDSNTNAVEAEKMMLKSHVRMKIVIDKDQRFIGVVSLDDLNSQTVMQKQTQGYDRRFLSVKDFMRRPEELRAFAYAELEKATIGDVIRTLEDNGQQHCLVIDQDSNEIRGLISASDIARKLRLPIHIARRSNFSEIFKAVAHA